MAHMRLLAQFVLDYTRLKLQEPAASDDEAFLRAAYRTLLWREPDPEAKANLLPALRSRRISRSIVMGKLFYSQEFHRLHAQPAPSGPNWRALLRLQLRLARMWLASDEAFLETLYRVLLNRALDNDGRAHFLPALRQRRMTRREVITAVMASPEYSCFGDLPMHPLEAAHQSRIALISRVLPPAERVVDLGGASQEHAQGALLLMGYPYRPREITIIDLPPLERIGNQRSDAHFDDRVVDFDGTKVRYLYQSMTKLDNIADASIDLVVSGESIEHITEEDADTVCRETYRILRPGGSFCLDTPNAILTRLQSPDEFIHPEHKKEYYVHELRDKLIAHGFSIADERAVCPMPRSRREGRFDYREMVENVGVSDNPEDGYMFYLRAVKPVAQG